VEIGAFSKLVTFVGVVAMLSGLVYATGSR